MKEIKIYDKTLVEINNIVDLDKININTIKKLISLISKTGVRYIEVPTKYIDIFKFNDKIIKYEEVNRTEVSEDIFMNYEEYFEKNTVLKNTVINVKNTLGMSTALTIEAIRCNYKNIEGAFLGIGDSVPLEELICQLVFLQNKMIYADLKVLMKISNIIEEILNIDITYNKPIVGKRVFYVESGIHVDGILKKTNNYEAFSPELVGNKREIILGKFSGRRAVESKLDELGISYNSEEIEHILKKIKQLSQKYKREITKEELLGIVKGGDEYDADKNS